MEFSPCCLDFLNGLVILGWLTLLFAPQNKKLVHYATLGPALLLSVIYTYILIKLVTSQKVDFFSLSSWVELLKQRSFAVGTVIHFRYEDLWVGRIMVETFYSSNEKYYAQHWIFSKIWLAFILLVTYLAGPCGLMLFWLSRISLFKPNGEESHTNEVLAIGGVAIAVIFQFFTVPAADTLFQLNNLIVFGWIGLIFFPTKSFAKYLVFIPTLAVASIYTGITLWKMRPFFSASTFNVLAFFRIEEWQRIFQDPYNVVAATSHFCVGDIWVGRWMTEKFYGKSEGDSPKKKKDSSKKSAKPKHSLVETIIFGVVLFVAYMVNPLGFLIFYALQAFCKPKFEPAHPINRDLEDTKRVYWYEILPQPLLNIFLLGRGILGIVVLLVVFLPGYFLLFIVCYLIGGGHRPPTATAPKFPPPNVSYGTAKLRLWLLQNPQLKNTFLYPLHILLQFATFLEYIPNSTQPAALFESLANYFGGDYFPFGDGVGINNRQRSIEWMQPKDKNDIKKGPESLGWDVSSSQRTFSTYTAILIPDQQKTQDARMLVHKWLENYPSQLKDKDRFRAQLRAYFPWGGDHEPKEDQVFEAVGTTLFLVLSQGGQFTKEELQSYLTCVKNPFIFFPNWFNFLAAGGLLERQGLDGYLCMRSAFCRYPDKLEGVVAEAKKRNVPVTEAIRLLAIVFGLAGAAAPAKVAFAVVSKLHEDPKWLPIFRKNPDNFVREIARLDKSVPMVNFFSRNPIPLTLGESKVTLPENTPFHASVVSANIDEKTFPDALVFNPERKNLGDIVVWNGLESDIQNPDVKNRPPRYCPGHDYSIDVIKEVAELFMPDFKLVNARKIYDQAFKDSKIKYLKDLDIYTLAALGLMALATKSWNSAPPHGPDIIPPNKLPNNSLDTIRTDMNKEIPTWDEDEPAGDSIARKGARWFVNSAMLPFSEFHKEWKHINEAIGWRQNLFADLPLPHIYYDNLDEMTVRMAFTGLSCHYTKLYDKKNKENIRYVSDLSALNLFEVRAGYEKYGAAAYFDANCNLVKIIYNQNKTSKPGDIDWKHAQWVYRTSCFAMVTIYDHLLVCHLTESNALVTNISKYLSQSHPLRNFLKPFAYRSVSVNSQAAASLVNSHGLVRRIWGFSHNEFLRLSEWATTGYAFRTLPNFIHPSMRSEKEEIFPMNHDAIKFWEIVRAYVSEWVESYEKKAKTSLLQDKEVIAFNAGLSVQLGIPIIETPDIFIDTLTQLIVNGTGIHEFVGQVADYVMRPDFVGACLRPGSEIQNVQEYTRMLILSTVTGLKVPRLMDDWSHLCEDHLEIYKNFKNRLMELNLLIVNKNKSRKYPFWSFCPEKLEISVSV